jgi:hypothetical protein
MQGKGDDPLARDACAHRLIEPERLEAGQEPEPASVGVLERGPGARSQVRAWTLVVEQIARCEQGVPCVPIGRRPVLDA